MQGYDASIALDFFEAMPGDTAGSTEYEHNHVRVMLVDNYPEKLTVTTECSLDHPWSEFLYAVTKDFLELYLSETTNNDACETSITEKSAHHDADPQHRVVVHTELLDWMT